MFLLGEMIQVPEMAIQQGVDLFDTRLIDAFELMSAIMMKQVPEGLVPADIDFVRLKKKKIKYRHI